MLLVLACGALLVLAVAAAWRWRRYSLQLPEWAAGGEGASPAPVRALVWLLAVALLTGVLVGTFVVGPAARLAMRLLAAASPDAQGRLTEAEEVVGEISLDGTLAIFVFIGLPVGIAVGFVYALVSFVLPRGVVGGAILGASLLVIFGSRLDPLREDNPDFGIVGPGWLSVTTFTAMAVLTGILTAPIAGRIGAALPPPRLWWLAWALPFGLLAAAALSGAPVAVVIVGCLVFVAAVLVPRERRVVVWRRGRIVVQGILAATVGIALPGFLSAVSTIAG